MKIYQSIRQMLVKSFHESENSEETLKAMCNLSVPAEAILSKYPELPSLESLEPEDKLDIKKTVHEMFPGKSPEFKLRAAKIIYTFSHCVEE